MSTSVSHPLVCTECGRCFSRPCDLKRHALIHKPDAKRYHCAYPGCTHSSLQRANLKTHYISRHLSQRFFHCGINGCTKTYRDDSSLIKHEKNHHGFFRRAQRPYERRRMSPSVRLGLDPSVFVKGASEQRTPSPTPSLCYSYSGYLSHVSQSLSPAPVMGPVANDGVQHNDEFLMASASTDNFLHEMIPELFPDPMYRAPPSIPPSNSSFKAEFTFPVPDPYSTYSTHGEEILGSQQPYQTCAGYGEGTMDSQEPNVTYSGYGAEMLDSNIFTPFDPFNLTLSFEPPFEPPFKPPFEPPFEPSFKPPFEPPFEPPFKPPFKPPFEPLPFRPSI